MTEVRNIVLTGSSREALSKKTENTLFDSVASQIEYGDWFIPTDETEFSRLREILVSQLRDFFSLSEDDPIEIKRFDTGILSFRDGVYPDYSAEEGDPDYFPDGED